MDRKIKLATAASLLALTAVACTPNPYYGNAGTGYNNNYGNRGVTTNGGAVGNRSSGNGTPVTHTHCGRTHTHVMPAGTHQHGDGCTATGGAAPATNTNTSAYNYGGNGGNYGTQPQQPAPNNYGGGYTAPTTAPYYDYSAGTNTSSTYTAPAASGYNNGASNYNAGSSNGSYYDYVAPKAATNTPYRSMPQTTSSNSTANKAGASGSYTVQKGDTVFQVMRNSGVYWKDIIRLNNLEAPNYPLTPGQHLKLK